MSKLLDLIHSKQKKIAESKNRLNTIKVKNGTNRYRLLPSWRGEGEEFWRDYAAHWVKDSLNTMKGVFTCQYITHGQQCPVCDAINKAKKTVDEGTAAILDQARATRRVLINVIEVHGDKPTEPQILEIPNSVFEDLLNLFTTWGEKLIQLKQGHDFTITRSGQGRNTNYTISPCPDATDVNPEILKRLPDLDKAVMTNSDATNALNGIAEIAGVLPATTYKKPVLSSVPAETPALEAAHVSESAQVVVDTAKPTEEASVVVEDISESMSDAELQKFISDL